MVESLQSMKNILLILYLIFSVVAIPVNANDEQARIEAKQVNIRNYEQFVAQLERDLPVGTSLQDVEAYLSKNKINYGYASQEGCVKFMLKKIYSAFFVFNTDLQVKIFLSEETGVSEIKSDLIETAF